MIDILDMPDKEQPELLGASFTCRRCDITFRGDTHPGRCWSCGRYAKNTACGMSDCACRRRRKARAYDEERARIRAIAVQGSGPAEGG